MIRVFHAVAARYLDKVADVDFPANYVHVADVKTDDLEKAFELTNTIDRFWWENRGVHPNWKGAREWALRIASQYGDRQTRETARRHAGEGFRSTSVGDVLEKNGVYYFVGRIGFERFPSTAVVGYGRGFGADSVRMQLDDLARDLELRTDAVPRLGTVPGGQPFLMVNVVPPQRGRRGVDFRIEYNPYNGTWAVWDDWRRGASVYKTFNGASDRFRKALVHFWRTGKFLRRGGRR